MYPLSIVSLILALITGGVLLSTSERQSEHRALQVQAITSNLVVMSGYVSAFSAANPHFSGWIPQASLNLPSWYVRHPNVHAFKQGGTTYVFASGLHQSQIDSMVSEYEHGRPLDNRYGVKRSGVLQVRGGASIPIPGDVPEGAFVVLL